MDQVIPFGARESALALGRRLRAESFQVALILPNSFRSAGEAWWAGIPQRVGYAGQLRNWLLTRPVAPRPGAVRMHKRSPSEVRALIGGASSGGGGGRPAPAPRLSSTAHHLHQYLHLAAALGADPTPLAPQISIGDAEVQACRGKFQIQTEHPMVGLNAGAEYGPAKRWPAERFIATAGLISRKLRCTWIVFGGSRDRQLADEIARGIDNNGTTPPQKQEIINLAGRTSLRELCALLRLCRVLLTNDTGPMHLAAAVGTPVVVPFGSTSPELTGPGLPGDERHTLLKAEVPCAPCFLRECPIDLRCLTGISAEMAAEAMLRILPLQGPITSGTIYPGRE